MRRLSTTSFVAIAYEVSFFLESIEWCILAEEGVPLFREKTSLITAYEFNQ